MPGVSADLPYRLSVVPPAGAPFQIDLEDELLIGRHVSCDLTLNHETVSANHALVEVKGASVAIKDLASTNGTIVAGHPIRGEEWLKDNATVEIGAFQLKLIRADLEPRTDTAPLPKNVVRLDERDRGVIDALLAEWADPSVQIAAARGAEEMARDLHCSRQEVNRRVARLEAKLGLGANMRGPERYRQLAEELLRRGIEPGGA